MMSLRHIDLRETKFDSKGTVAQNELGNSPSSSDLYVSENIVPSSKLVGFVSRILSEIQSC
jgi:hypothetical protein